MRTSTYGAVALAFAVGSIAQDQQDSPEYDNPCKSFGIDFQDGGSYFQNQSSSDDFTFVSTFEGCANDVATNVLVDPVGDQYLCSDTNLQPDDTFQMSTCPLEKDELSSGAWSVIIISNNGDEAPIAYQRDFSLSVGIAVTTTYTPTVGVSATTTPIVTFNSTNTVTETATSTKVVTSPYVKSKTITQTPKRVTTTKTKIVGTITKKVWQVVPTVITKTTTKTCIIPHRQPHRDPWCTIIPTVAFAAALETASSTTYATATGGPSRRRDASRHIAENRAEFLAAREARLAGAEVIEKRGLDNATVTSTELDTAKWVTSTTWSTAAATTVTMTTDSTKSVVTTSTSTSYSGVTKVLITKTAPTPTKTKTKYTIVKTTATITRRPTVTVTIRTAPAQSTAICKAKGGKLV